MRIAILGAGGVGGYFGGKLAASGTDVTFVARGRHLEALQDRGLRITSTLGDVVLRTVNAVDDIGKVDAVDLVVVGVKLWDTEQIAPTLKPLVERGAAVISLQNGVQKDEILGTALGADTMIGGLGYIAANIVEPGVIGHSGTLQRLIFGEFDGCRSVRTVAFLEACTRAGIDIELSNTIEQRIWEKFVFLVGLSGATCFFRRPIGEIRDDPDARSLLGDLMEEALGVGRARDVTLAADYAQDQLRFCDTLPARMGSSMYTDLTRGNRLELPWLSGAVVDMGKAADVATPANARVTQALTPFVGGRG